MKFHIKEDLKIFCIAEINKVIWAKDISSSNANVSLAVFIVHATSNYSDFITFS